MSNACVLRINAIAAQAYREALRDVRLINKQLESDKFDIDKVTAEVERLEKVLGKNFSHADFVDMQILFNKKTKAIAKRIEIAKVTKKPEKKPIEEPKTIPTFKEVYEQFINDDAFKKLQKELKWEFMDASSWELEEFNDFIETSTKEAQQDIKQMKRETSEEKQIKRAKEIIIGCETIRAAIQALLKTDLITDENKQNKLKKQLDDLNKRINNLARINDEDNLAYLKIAMITIEQTLGITEIPTYKPKPTPFVLSTSDEEPVIRSKTIASFREVYEKFIKDDEFKEIQEEITEELEDAAFWTLEEYKEFIESSTEGIEQSLYEITIQTSQTEQIRIAKEIIIGCEFLQTTIQTLLETNLIIDKNRQNKLKKSLDDINKRINSLTSINNKDNLEFLKGTLINIEKMLEIK